MDRQAFDVREATIERVQHALFTGQTTCRDVVTAFLSRINALNPIINAIIALNPQALDIADRLDAALAAGSACGPLFGVPIMIKDNFNTFDMPTTGGCLALAKLQPEHDAPSVRMLRGAGAIVLGKTNLHEMALEGLSVSSLGGQTVNPYDYTRTPGGSSGGSAAAVAASFCILATGTDTVNSLRNPASANSLFSCRPTRGLISRAGVIPVSETQDTVGPMARNVKDLATALSVMASIGADSLDSATTNVPSEVFGKNYTRLLTAGGLQAVRFGSIESFFDRVASGETDPVNDAMSDMVRKLQSLGATVIPIYDQTFDAVSILKTLDTQRYEYGKALDDYLQEFAGGVYPKTFKHLYESGEYLVIPAQYEYIHAALSKSTSDPAYSKIRDGIRQLVQKLENTFSLHNLDALIYPQQKNLVVKIGSPSQSGRNGILAALTGRPVVVVPAGCSRPTDEACVGIPIGMEILGRPWTEDKLLQIAYRLDIRFPLRKAPSLAEAAVSAEEMVSVPTVVPGRSHIHPSYPLGTV